jgi:V/A-type H+-transporting ATPase subunit K
MEEIFNLGPTLALAGGAIASLLGGIGSSVGMGLAGATGAGVVAEKPEYFGKVLVLEALPGSQGIYGLLGAFLVLNTVGEKLADLNATQGWQIFFACMPLALTALFSGIYQGKVAAAGMNIIAKKPENSGNAIILSAMVETFAILGLLATVLMLRAVAL